MRSAIPSWIVVAEALKRDQDNIVLRLLGRRVRRIRHRNDRRGILRESTNIKESSRKGSGDQTASRDNQGLPQLHSFYSALSSISSICRHKGRSSMQSIRATEASARSIVEVRQGSVVTTKGSRCFG